MKGVSIIIACYKAGDYVRQAVESVHAVAPNLPYEIIIVDDASNDKATQFALNALNLADQKVRISEQPVNRGQSVARNIAIGMAKYDYIFPMDADDLLNPAKPGYLDEAVKRLEKNPDAVVAYCAGRVFGARQSPILLPKYSERMMLMDNMIFVYGVYRRSDALEIGGYKEDLRYTEDWEIWLALHNARFLQDKPRTAEYIGQQHYLYRQYETANNVSKAQRMPPVEHMAALTKRSGELYDHHLGTRDPETLAAIWQRENTFAKQMSRRLMDTPFEVLVDYGMESVRRKYVALMQRPSVSREDKHHHIPS